VWGGVLRHCGDFGEQRCWCDVDQSSGILYDEVLRRGDRSGASGAVRVAVARGVAAGGVEGAGGVGDVGVGVAVGSIGVGRHAPGLGMGNSLLAAVGIAMGYRSQFLSGSMAGSMENDPECRVRVHHELCEHAVQPSEQCLLPHADTYKCLQRCTSIDQ